jgi:uncharacterized integral membrane protein
MSDTSPTTPADGSTAPNPAAEPSMAPAPTGEPATQARSSRPDKGEDPLRGSRTSGIWAGVISLGVVLILLIIFIAQNTDDVDVAFLGWEGRAPLSVTLLIAAAAGLFLAGIAGMLRILQLRRRVRRGERS